MFKDGRETNKNKDHSSNTSASCLVIAVTIKKTFWLTDDTLPDITLMFGAVCSFLSRTLHVARLPLSDSSLGPVAPQSPLGWSIRWSQKPLKPLSRCVSDLPTSLHPWCFSIWILPVNTGELLGGKKNHIYTYTFLCFLCMYASSCPVWTPRCLSGRKKIPISTLLNLVNSLPRRVEAVAAKGGPTSLHA